MSYTTELTNKINKYKAFFEDESPGQILAYIYPYDLKEDLSPYFSKEGPQNPLDNQVRFMRALLGARKANGVDDDYIPSVSPGKGIALNSVYFSDAELLESGGTSWVHPVIHEWDDMEKLTMDINNKWFRYISEANKRFVELNEGDYLVHSFSHFSPIDMANALRGNQLFYDFYDYPEEVHKLMDLSAKAIIWLEEEQRKIVKPALGGTGIWGVWVPGSTIFMSEDASDLISPELYREFAFPHTQKVIDAFDGAFIHHHSKGMHVHKDIIKLKGLKMIEMSMDPNTPKPIDHIDEIIEWNQGMPIMTRCTPSDLYKHIDKIKQGRVMLMISVETFEEGKEAMRFIRKHSKI